MPTAPGISSYPGKPEPQSDGIDQHQQDRLNEYRISQPYPRCDRLMEFRQIGRGYDVCFYKKLYRRPNALMNEILGREQDRKGNEKSDVDLDVLKESDIDRSIIPLDQRKYQQGQPCDADYSENSRPQTLHASAREASLPPQLEKRTAGHERELVGIQHSRMFNCDLCGHGF